MKINELLERGVTLYSVAEVVQVTEPDGENPYGREISLWKPPCPQDLHAPVEHDWGNRELAKIWPIHENRYPTLQLEVW